MGCLLGYETERDPTFIGRVDGDSFMKNEADIANSAKLRRSVSAQPS